MFVTLGIYSLRRRQGKDLPEATYKMPFYPVLPALGFIGSLFVFWGLMCKQNFIQEFGSLLEF